MHLWQWFCEIVGPERLTFAEIDAWQRVTGASLSGWEVSALRQMDAVRHEIAAKKAEGRETTVPATPENMKAMFARIGAMKKPYRTTTVK